jgi:hypothetical protein
MPSDIMNDRDVKAAYDEGAQTFQVRRDHGNNPYKQQSEQAKAWEQGFLDAQKAAQRSGDQNETLQH